MIEVYTRAPNSNAPRRDATAPVRKKEHRDKPKDNNLCEINFSKDTLLVIILRTAVYPGARAPTSQKVNPVMGKIPNL